MTAFVFEGGYTTEILIYDFLLNGCISCAQEEALNSELEILNLREKEGKGDRSETRRSTVPFFLRTHNLRTSFDYRLLMVCLVALWLIMVAWEQICDVWDETDLLLNNSTAPSTVELVKFLWTHHIYFYRPLGACVIGLVSRSLEYDVAWHVLRFLNAGLLLVSLFLLLQVLRKWNGTDRTRDLLVTVLFLFSGSAIITTGWFPILFDAGVLCLLLAGVLALVHERPFLAGFLMGSAFFFKETAAMAVPLLLGLWLMGKINSRALVVASLLMGVLGGIYGIERIHLIPLGSEQDIHPFHWGRLIPTAWGWTQSFWYQSVAHLGLPDLGVLWLLLSLAFFKQRKALIGALLLVILPVFLYWGMFGVYRNSILVTGAHFQGRLYLVPAALLLLWLATWGKRPVLILLLVPVLLGAFRTYRDHLRFQGCYAQIYQLQSTDTVSVNYPEKPLNDWRRHIRVGDYPQSGYQVDARTGMVITKTSNSGVPPPLLPSQSRERE